MVKEKIMSNTEEFKKQMLTVSPLSEENVADFFSFFDHLISLSEGRIVTYSEHWSMSEKELKALHELPRQKNLTAEEYRSEVKNAASLLIQSGKKKGYLAYMEGKPIGWCDVNLKSAYEYLGRELPESVTKDRNPDTLSVVSILVSPEYRGQGVATALLDRVMQDASKNKIQTVEAYPSMHEFSDGSFPVYLHLFLKAGFQTVYQGAESAVLQKRLCA